MSESCLNITKGYVTVFYTMAVSGMCDVMVILWMAKVSMGKEVGGASV